MAESNQLAPTISEIKLVVSKWFNIEERPLVQAKWTAIVATRESGSSARMEGLFKTNSAEEFQICTRF